MRGRRGRNRARPANPSGSASCGLGGTGHSRLRRAITVEEASASQKKGQDDSDKRKNCFEEGDVEIFRRERGTVHGHKERGQEHEVHAHGQKTAQEGKLIFRHVPPISGPAGGNPPAGMDSSISCRCWSE